MKIGFYDKYGDETRAFFSSVSESLKPVLHPSDIGGLNCLFVGGASKDNEDYWNRFGNKKNIKFLEVGETFKFKE